MKNVGPTNKNSCIGNLLKCAEKSILLKISPSSSWNCDACSNSKVLTKTLSSEENTDLEETELAEISKMSRSTVHRRTHLNRYWIKVFSEKVKL
jgi:hypothetical protein